MKTIVSLLSAFAIAGCGHIFAADSSFGYSNGSCDRNNVFHVGNAQAGVQGVAVRLTPEKVAMLNGLKINSVSATFGSSYTTDNAVTLFIGTDPSNPEYTQTVKITRALKWLDFALDTPFEIKDNAKDLYIGYTGEITPDVSLLMHDGAFAPTGYCFAYDGTAWADIAGNQWGCPNIKFTVADAPALTDLMLRPIDTAGYYKAETPYRFNGTLYNFGNEAIRSFDLGITIGDYEPVIKKYTDIEIAPSGSFAYELDEYTASAVGKLPIKLDVSNVNGIKDSDASDNVFEGNLFLYPADMERSIMIEGFTGQDCSNCPSGHAAVNQFIEDNPEISFIEVMHHAGYKPDYFTMAASGNYTYLYGANNTFAPAMMINRTHFPSLGNVPVMGTSTTTLEKACEIMENTQPFISLNLQTAFDPETRELKVTVDTYTHNDLPYNNNVIQVFLVQDGLESYQSGGGSYYTHNAVFRGTLTGNAWGKLLPESFATAGKRLTREYSMTIPDKIFSDYWGSISNPEKYMIDAVPENMKVVAFVEALGGEDLSSYYIYNAAEVKMGESHKQAGFVEAGEDGIATPEGVPAVSIRVVNGRVVVDGEYDTMAVYSLQGRTLNPASALTPGIYIVNVVAGDKNITKKISVR